MSIFRLNPYSLETLWEEELKDNRKNYKTFIPSVDIKETDKDYVIHVELPGVKKEGVEIVVDGDYLIIKGEKNSQHSEEKDGYRSNERVYGSFLRKFVLPDSLDNDKIEAKSIDGVLAITIPKKPLP